MATPPRPTAAATDAFLLGGTDLLVATDTAGRITWRNAAFDRETGLDDAQILGRPLVDLALPASDAAALRALRAGFDGGGAVPEVEIALPARGASTTDDLLWCRVRAVRFGAGEGADAGYACVLHDHRQLRRERREAHRLAELLDMAQDFGRLGVWEREIPSGRGHWDRHVFRFFDIDPADGTPDHTLARAHIHPDDRDNLLYVESTRRAGRYSRRYRTIGKNGEIRVIHSQWAVKADGHGTPTRAIGIMMDDTEAFEMARSLERTNARLQLAVELAGIGLWRHDLATNLLHYDPHTFRMLGWPPRDGGIPLDEVRAQIHPDDVGAVAASLARALATDAPTEMEARYRHGDGSWRVILNRRLVERDANGQPVAFSGVGIDITDRIQNARSSLELARRLESIARAARLGTWSIGIESQEAEWNGRMYELYGVPRERGPLGWADLLKTCVHPDDRDRQRRISGAWLRDPRGPLEMEFRVCMPDGAVRWILSRSDMEQRGAQRQLYGIAMDITDRKRTEIALQEASERVALAARGAGIGTWMLDAKSGMTYWDEQMFILRGLEPGPVALTEEQRLAMTHPDDRRRVLDAVHESLRTGEPTTYEFRILRPDGQWRWLASRSIPVLDAEGRVVRQTGVNWDVTEVRNHELERQERIAAQRESQAKSKFLARISHELRTPLNAVLGFAELMIAEADGMPPGQRVKLEHIRSAGAHLLSLINEVLDLSILQSGEMRIAMEPVSLARVVGETLPLMLPQAGARGIALHTDGLDVAVRADATRLRQVIFNLVSNAIKYNRDGGHVHIGARADHTTVTLSVRDTGRGIAPALIKHLFEPFNRLGLEREGIEGTGIGLAVVAAIVERMGGRVSATSALGAGSEFVVALERADASPQEPPAPLPTPADEQPGVRYEGKVLYIEDNPVNVLIVSELVARFDGIAMASEETGEAGVARARAWRPDLVLIDMQLPDIDGFEVLRRLRADPATAGLTCIALSANAMPEDIARALAAGMDDYWTKPVDFRAFAAAIDRMFERERH